MTGRNRKETGRLSPAGCLFRFSQTGRVPRCSQGAGVCCRCGGALSPRWLLWVLLHLHRVLLPHPPLQSCQVQREKPKRISLGGLNHRCVLEKSLSQRGIAKILHSYYVCFYWVYKATKPNTLLSPETVCEHVCTHVRTQIFFLADAVFLMLERLGTAAALSFFLSHCSILWLHLSQVTSTGKKGIPKYIQLGNYFWVK